MPSGIRLLITTLVLLTGATAAVAGHPPVSPAPAPVSATSKPVAQEHALPGPNVIAHPELGGQIREYRYDNRLYMVQLQPRAGTPYFLLDTDGDGVLETRYNDLDDRIVIPDWVLNSQNPAPAHR